MEFYLNGRFCGLCEQCFATWWEDEKSGETVYGWQFDMMSGSHYRISNEAIESLTNHGKIVEVIASQKPGEVLHFLSEEDE